MIELQNIYIEKAEDKVFFKADCLIDNQLQVLWFSTDIANEKYISTSNADAFILFIFFYAVFENLEFKSNVPVSKRLKFGLLEVLLPAFQEMGFKAQPEQFSFELEDDSLYPEATAVGTAMSFGIDSFYTLIKGNGSIQKLNYLTLFNAGAYGNYGGDKAKELFDAMKNRVDTFANQNNLGFAWVDTNLNETFRFPYIQSHTFRNFACVLVLQKLFKTYYYASTFSINDFRLTQSDPSNYDLLNSKAISTNSLEFHITGLIENRIDKTKVVSSNEISYDNLNVCLVTSDYAGASLATTAKNCSKCEKCVRTMVTLDILGKLELYKSVFDLNIYAKNKNKYLAHLLYKKYRANYVFSKDIFNEAKVRNYNIPAKAYYLASMRVFQPIVRKLKH
ncbi:hypothetical protein [Aequorivita capsosiphonis]|uniref:hypothetical protein n=1 Tax=Aequorivita capsosiphonis TaxID=487317 RepID=UPI0004017D0C|nr:hypothetical protein [Aequorivita capsosiphonis]